MISLDVLLRRSFVLPAVAALLGACAHATQPAGVVLQPSCPANAACNARDVLIWNDSSAVPAYPPVLRSAAVEGAVAIRFLVAIDGTVDTSTAVVESATNRAFTPYVKRALAQWRFTRTPARKSPAPIPMMIRVAFTLGPTCAAGVPKVTSEWTERSPTPKLTVTACAFKLVPRDQLSPRELPRRIGQ